jgi:hypothetical protein
MIVFYFAVAVKKKENERHGEPRELRSGPSVRFCFSQKTETTEEKA